LIQGYRKEGQVSLVFKYQKSKTFLVYLNSIDLIGIKYYLKALLTAVNGLAEVGIMHRDIKPSNFLYDPDTKTGLLIDFGLSELELDSNSKPKRLPDDPTVKKIHHM
jgi:cell division control protein 7